MNLLKRRPFLLLEVMIAIALVTLCILPLISTHVYLYRSQSRFIEDVEADHIVNAVMGNILERLYQKKIEWKSIEEKTQFLADKALLENCTLSCRQFVVSYGVKDIKSKSDEAKTYSVNLVTWEIAVQSSDFEKKRYTFDVVITKGRKGDTGEKPLKKLKPIKEHSEDKQQKEDTDESL